MFHNLNKVLYVEQRTGVSPNPKKDHPVRRNQGNRAAPERAALQGERLAGGTG